jgi:hypothetical protein
MTYDEKSTTVREFGETQATSDRRADSSALRRLLKCPNCRVDDTLELTRSPVVCGECGAAFSASGGILDFVAGRDNTALDVIAYDLEKNVSIERSRVLFGKLKQDCGALLPENLGKVLEIGAGTGLLTLGMLELSEFDSAVISDISPEMLLICRARAESCLDAGKFSRALFMTYSGRSTAFRAKYR